MFHIIDPKTDQPVNIDDPAIKRVLDERWIEYLRQSGPVVPEFNDPPVDDHEDQADFYAEMEAEAASALPPLCPCCGEVDCDCSSKSSASPLMVLSPPWTI